MPRRELPESACRSLPLLPVDGAKGRGTSFPLRKKSNQSRAPAAPHLRALPTPGFDYLVFSSFTRITLQNPRSIMLLWKRDSCPRGGRDSMSLGGLREPAKESPCSVSRSLCLRDCPPGNRTTALHFPQDPDAHAGKRVLWSKGKNCLLYSTALGEWNSQVSE